MKCILDHSIESNARLLQSTDQVFAPRSTRDADASCVVTRDQATQCESLTDCCLDERCTSLRDLVSSLRTNIEVLETEAAALRTEKMSCE
ncbi:hypothetical protein J6590_107971, partial [Homalodisca vitripennis]